MREHTCLCGDTCGMDIDNEMRRHCEKDLLHLDTGGKLPVPRYRCQLYTSNQYLCAGLGDVPLSDNRHLRRNDSTLHMRLT